jgi:DNA helicase-4
VVEHEELFDGKRVDTDLLEQHLRDELQRRDVDLHGTDEYETHVPEIGDFYDSQQADQRQWRVYCYNKLWVDLIEEFVDFVTKAKENQKDPHNELRQADETEYEDVVWTFSECAATVADEYAARLDGMDVYDFSDLIIEATEILENPPAGFDPTGFAYEHIMVDEFQDLNLTQLELVQALLGLNDDACLFVIGDDWQSIYGFKAAKPEYFIDFQDHFAPCTRTELQVNYRCDDDIVEGGNSLIGNNNGQIEKTVRAFSDDTGEIYVHTVPATDSYTEAAVDQIIELVETSNHLHDVGGGQRGGDIMVLARTKAGSPYIRRVRQELQKRDINVGDHEESDAVTVDTAHSAKGEEAEHVIAAHATEAAGGFPTTEQLSLQELVETRPSGEDHVEEERRLFYVVVTRAKSRVDIQTSDDSPSRFISELRDHVQFDNLGDPTELDSLQSAEDDRVSAVGTVVDQYSQNVGRVRVKSFSDGSFPHLAGETLKYVQFTDLEPSEGDQVELANALINEYEGDLQLKMDGQASFDIRS